MVLLDLKLMAGLVLITLEDMIEVECEEDLDMVMKEPTVSTSDMHLVASELDLWVN